LLLAPSPPALFAGGEGWGEEAFYNPFSPAVTNI